ncbi:hypothetical protein BV25DRAFT_1896586 [Artomyces pyxidatus]|uniref:Uncharacterized protein n=1 Tax=Artomyces pyxidatus TaxID=48021 RepID=A0ACB8TJ26_9AGAM|nr:hypothetical protein BV25DRAFT_1896586 [Artomyces pyxidatus]
MSKRKRKPLGKAIHATESDGHRGLCKQLIPTRHRLARAQQFLQLSVASEGVRVEIVTAAEIGQRGGDAFSVTSQPERVLSVECLQETSADHGEALDDDDRKTGLVPRKMMNALMEIIDSLRRIGAVMFDAERLFRRRPSDAAELLQNAEHDLSDQKDHLNVKLGVGGYSGIDDELNLDTQGAK